MSGESADQVWAIGEVGPYYQRRRVVLRYDGATWSEVYRTSAQIRRLWAGPGPTVYATGDHGVVVVGTGDGWTRQSHGLSLLPIHAVWGVTPAEAMTHPSEWLVEARRQ